MALPQVAQVASIPGRTLYDKNLSAEAKVLVATILTESIGDGCALTNSALAGKLGWSAATLRKYLEEAIKAGWIFEEENGRRHLVVCFVRNERAETVMSVKKTEDIFDDANLVVDEKSINHLIKVFIDSGINDTITAGAIENRFYGNPYNRHGAKKLIVEKGLDEAEAVLSKVAKRCKEKFCPEIKSLYSMHEKWDR